jgi:hypothetical protein
MPGLEQHGETTLEEHPRAAPHQVLTALACARALLDELETVIERAADEQARSGVVAQLAEHLVRLAGTMTQWDVTDT